MMIIWRVGRESIYKRWILRQNSLEDAKSCQLQRIRGCADRWCVVEWQLEKNNPKGRLTYWSIAIVRYAVQNDEEQKDSDRLARRTWKFLQCGRQFISWLLQSNMV